MPEVKRIVCLANSRKTSGRCLAGKESTANGPGGWIRPVSNRETQEVSEEERRYQDGTDPLVLDVIDVPLLEYKPGSFQQENWLLDPSQHWVRTARLPYDQLAGLVDSPNTLWLNGSSTSAGLNDRITHEQANEQGISLYLIKLEELTIRVFAPGAYFGNPKRRVQAQFTYRGVQHWLWVTDPKIERQYLEKENGEYQLGECYATVSLGEPYEGYCYKLVAALIFPGA